MIVIDPITLGPAQLIAAACTIPEPDTTHDPAAWNAATAYAVDDLVRRDAERKVYRRIVAGTTATAPEADIEGAPGITNPNWEYERATNRYACFDQAVNTKCIQNTGPLELMVAPGELANALTLLEMEADGVTITGTDGLAGPVVYSRTVDLVTDIVTDWYEYFFEPFTRQGTLKLFDLPPYLNLHIKVSLSGAGAIKLGGLVVGTTYELGGAQQGIEVGGQDYSKKITSRKSGITRIEPGNSRKTMRVMVEVDKANCRKVQQLLNRLLGVPTVWIGIEGDADYDSFDVFGYCNGFKQVVTFPTYAVFSIDIQGLT